MQKTPRLSTAGRLFLLASACAAAVIGLVTPLASAAPPSSAHKTEQTSQAPVRLGLQMGLFGGTPAQVFAFGQSLSNSLGSALRRPVVWEVQTAKQTQEQPLRWMFVRPPDITATLLSKGWKLVAVTKGGVHFGVDLIAQPCPDQRGKVLLGGPKMALLGQPPADKPVCVDPAQLWTSPQAVLFTPKPDSLVERIALKLWRQHSARLPRLVHPGTQEGVVGLIHDMQVPAVGAVTSLIAQKWQAQGGMIVAQMHTQLPLGALVAAPDVPDADVAAVQAALVATPVDASIAKTLQANGWEPGQPREYAKLLEFLAP